VRLRDAIIDKTEGWLTCGPVVVAALTGAPLTTVEAVFAMNGSDGVETDAADLALARSHFGMPLSLGYVSDWGEEPPLWWCLRYCPDGPLIIAVEDRGEGHWIATDGWRLADVQTRGRWVAFDDHGLHADAPVETVWLVEGRCSGSSRSHEGARLRPPSADRSASR
jgi:hypothetical protein